MAAELHSDGELRLKARSVVFSHDVLATAVIVATLAVAAALAFKPWVPTPFPVYDFSGLLTTFQEQGSFGSIVRALNVDYAREGRLFPVQTLVLAFTWVLFDGYPVGWYWTRFFLLLGVVGLSVTLLRRFGMTYIAAGCGAALFVVASGPAVAWYSLAMSEPIGLAFLLCSALGATRYQASSRPRATAALIGLFLVGAIGAKETFIAAVPFVLAVAALRFPIDVPRVPRVTRRFVELVVVVGSLILVLNLIPLALVLSHAQVEGYGSRYTLGDVSGRQIQNAFYATILPVTRAPHFPANIAYASIVLLGLFAVWRNSGARLHLASMLVGAALLIAGAVVYSPWPAYPGYYALAFLPGTALILGGAISAIQTTAWRLTRGIAFGGVGLILVSGYVIARDGAAQYRAARRVERDVAERLMEPSSATTLLVGVPNPLLSGSFGRGLILYTRYLGADPSFEAQDVTCGEASNRARVIDEQSIVLHMSELCPEYPAIVGGTRIAYRVTSFDWRRLTVRDVPVTADIWRMARPPGRPASTSDAFRESRDSE